MQKAIIIGATSGIGRELAVQLSQKGYELGITGRRTALLEELIQILPNKVHAFTFDISSSDAQKSLKELIDKIGEIDLIIISAGTGHINTQLPWDKEKETIDTNVIGFAAMANQAFHYFIKRGSGHLVGITSIAAIRGGESSSYNASKAFQANYLEGLRVNIKKAQKQITVTDVQPGFIDTNMAQGEGLFWVASPEKAARQIIAAIEAKKDQVYISKRWRIIGWVLKILPRFIYERIT